MNAQYKWILALCAVPVAIAAMALMIWLLRHGYLSVHHDGYWSSRLGHRQESRIIFIGLIGPFFAVLVAIVAFFLRKNRH